MVCAYGCVIEVTYFLYEKKADQMMPISQDERKGMLHHDEAIIYVSRTTPIGSPQTFFQMLFRKNPALPYIAEKVVNYIRRNGSLKASRYWYRKLCQEFNCTYSNLTTILYKLVAVGLLNREHGEYKFSRVFSKRLEQISTVVQDMQKGPGRSIE